ncbi:hypothetical protein C8R47DRAFT_1068934 [Mycena vitilis]|nr:hypothetical protein C8R47DRAFT_1068934 [Mycena vitilis]
MWVNKNGTFLLGAVRQKFYTKFPPPMNTNLRGTACKRQSPEPGLPGTRPNAYPILIESAVAPQRNSIYTTDSPHSLEGVFPRILDILPFPNTERTYMVDSSARLSPATLIIPAAGKQLRPVNTNTDTDIKWCRPCRKQLSLRVCVGRTSSPAQWIGCDTDNPQQRHFRRVGVFSIMSDEAIAERDGMAPVRGRRPRLERGRRTAGDGVDDTKGRERKLERMRLTRPLPSTTSGM